MGMSTDLMVRAYDSRSNNPRSGQGHVMYCWCPSLVLPCEWRGDLMVSLLDCAGIEPCWAVPCDGLAPLALGEGAVAGKGGGGSSNTHSRFMLGKPELIADRLHCIRRNTILNLRIKMSRNPQKASNEGHMCMPEYPKRRQN